MNSTIKMLGMLVAVAVVAVGAAFAVGTYNTVKWTNSTAGVTTAALVDAGGNASVPSMVATAGVFSSSAGFTESADSMAAPTGAYAWFCQITQPIATVSQGWIVPLCSADGVNFAPIDVTAGGQHYTPDAGWTNASNAAVTTSYVSVQVPPGQACNTVSLGYGVSYNDGGSIACQMMPERLQ